MASAEIFWKQEQLLSIFRAQRCFDGAADSLCVHHLRNSEVRVSNSRPGHTDCTKLSATVGSEYAGCNPMIWYWPSFLVYSYTWDIVLIGMCVETGTRGIQSLYSSSKCYDRLHWNEEISVILSRAWTRSFFSSFSFFNFFYIYIFWRFTTYLGLSEWGTALSFIRMQT